MEQITLSNVGTIKLNSFKPLCWTILGNTAIIKHGLNPFIDASCRREPDFENPSPSISALCRHGVFAPKLKIGDIVVYMTVGGKFAPHKLGHHLVAILQVEDIYFSHEHAAIAYNQAGLPIPSNCMVQGNQPIDLDKTGGNFKNNKEISNYLNRPMFEQNRIAKARIFAWDYEYQNVSLRFPNFVKTKPIYLDTVNPTLIRRSDFNSIFGKLPNSRTPCKIKVEQLILLSSLCGLEIRLK